MAAETGYYQWTGQEGAHRYAYSWGPSHGQTVNSGRFVEMEGEGVVEVDGVERRKVVVAEADGMEVR